MRILNFDPETFDIEDWNQLAEIDIRFLLDLMASLGSTSWGKRAQSITSILPQGPSWSLHVVERIPKANPQKIIKTHYSLSPNQMASAVARAIEGGSWKDIEAKGASCIREELTQESSESDWDCEPERYPYLSEFSAPRYGVEKLLDDHEVLSSYRDALLSRSKQKPAAQSHSKEPSLPAKHHGKSWSDVLIRATSNDMVEFRIGDFRKPFNFTDLGFKDGRKGDQPDSKWGVFLALLRSQGELNTTNLHSGSGPGSFTHTEKSIQDIRKKLKNKFPELQDKPIAHLKNGKYISTFSASDARTLDTSNTAYEDPREDDDYKSLMGNPY